jgi:hypothetical protein
MVDAKCGPDSNICTKSKSVDATVQSVPVAIQTVPEVTDQFTQLSIAEKCSFGCQTEEEEFPQESVPDTLIVPDESMPMDTTDFHVTIPESPKRTSLQNEDRETVSSTVEDYCAIPSTPKSDKRAWSSNQSSPARGRPPFKRPRSGPDYFRHGNIDMWKVDPGLTKPIRVHWLRQPLRVPIKLLDNPDVSRSIHNGRLSSETKSEVAYALGMIKVTPGLDFWIKNWWTGKLHFSDLFTGRCLIRWCREKYTCFDKKHFECKSRPSTYKETAKQQYFRDQARVSKGLTDYRPG